MIQGEGNAGQAVKWAFPRAGLQRKLALQVRKWRNWQTHQLEGLTVARPWGFESPLPHHLFLLL